MSADEFGKTVSVKESHWKYCKRYCKCFFTLEVLRVACLNGDVAWSNWYWHWGMESFNQSDPCKHLPITRGIVNAILQILQIKTILSIHKDNAVSSYYLCLYFISIWLSWGVYTYWMWFFQQPFSLQLWMIYHCLHCMNKQPLPVLYHKAVHPTHPCVPMCACYTFSNLSLLPERRGRLMDPPYPPLHLLASSSSSSFLLPRSLDANLYPSHCLRSNSAEVSHKLKSWCNMTQ